jgi:hypothetical protein
LIWGIVALPVSKKEALSFKNGHFCFLFIESLFPISQEKRYSEFATSQYHMTTNPINIIGNKLSINKKQKWPFLKLRASFLETDKRTKFHLKNMLGSADLRFVFYFEVF